MSIEVVVRIRSEEAESLRAGVAATRASREVLDATAQLGVALDPADPGASGTPLAGWFVTWVADPDLARDVVDSLSRCEAVEAAYIKPPAEVP